MSVSSQLKYSHNADTSLLSTQMLKSDATRIAITIFLENKYVQRINIDIDVLTSDFIAASRSMNQL